MEGRPSLVVCCTGVYVILQELSNWKNTTLLAKTQPFNHPPLALTCMTFYRMASLAHTCVDVIAVRRFPQSPHSCGDKTFKQVTGM